MTDPQRVDVARFDCTSGGANWCNGCYTMERHDDGDYVLHDDYAALLQQLADYDERGETITMMGREIADLKMQVLAAERARDELAGAVLAQVPTSWLDPLLTGPNAVIKGYEYNGSDIERLLGAIRERIAAFLAANK